MRIRSSLMNGLFFSKHDGWLVAHDDNSHCPLDAAGSAEDWFSPWLLMIVIHILRTTIPIKINSVNPVENPKQKDVLVLNSIMCKHRCFDRYLVTSFSLVSVEINILASHLNRSSVN